MKRVAQTSFLAREKCSSFAPEEAKPAAFEVERRQITELFVVPAAPASTPSQQ